MSNVLAPSKSTVYVSNLPFSLTNNDIYKVFEKYGKIVKVTIVKNKSRKSSGVAFIFFLNIEDARNFCKEVDNTELFGRTIKASIAKDNGRSTEFIRKRTYEDKSTCYECGEEGHLSYKCPKNILGIREPPPKKERKRKSQSGETSKEAMKSFYDDSDEEVQSVRNMDHKKTLKNDNEADEEEDTEEEIEPDYETLSAAIQMDREKAEEEGRVRNQDQGPKRKKIHKNSYFSDEEDISD